MKSRKFFISSGIIPLEISMPANDWKGYLEDRRPASNADPYRIVSMMINTVESVSS